MQHLSFVESRNLTLLQTRLQLNRFCEGHKKVLQAHDVHVHTVYTLEWHAFFSALVSITSQAAAAASLHKFNCKHASRPLSVSKGKAAAGALPTQQ